MSELPFEESEVARRLLEWYAREGRDLPWRRTRDPYRVWLSEIMLQQTTVAAVVPFYRRFLEVFPDLDSLAAAPVEAVIDIWAGMGYYSRARNLHAAAIKVATDFKGRFPRSLEDLLTLPGVGRSTAGAILSIAFDTPAPILDGNVRRVLCRLFAWSDDPRSAAAEKRFWAWADALTPEDRPHDYAQAVMDLGATVCTPRQPRCGDCPLKSLCIAHCKGLENDLPKRRKRKAPPLRRQVAVIVFRNGRCLVRRRPLGSMLGGLWEFPATDLERPLRPEEQARTLLGDLQLRADLARLGEVRHAYSHFRLDLSLFAAAAGTIDRVSENGEEWVDVSELKNLPLHGAHKKALKYLSQD